VVTVTGTPNGVIELLAYSRPSTTYRVVRRAETPSTGRSSFSVVPPTNTRLYARQVGCSGDSESRVLGVRTVISLQAVRTATRTYEFSGSVLPRRAGQLVTVYRRSSSGDVLTAQARTDARGVYRVRRTFSGTGTFAFFARTSNDVTNLGGISGDRSVAIR
jgi:hypothetical protein